MLRYYYDQRLLVDLLRYRMRPYMAAVFNRLEEKTMPPLDIQKLAQNISRANDLTKKAAAESDRGASILNNFEQHMASAGAHFDAIKVYDDQLVAMQQVMGNGGPALETATFPADAGPVPSVAATTTASSFHHDTGDPVR